MDEAWGWGILASLAILVSGSMIGVAPTIIDRTPQLGWWCVILAPAPLVVWNIMWIFMTNPPVNLSRTVSIVIGAIAGAVILFGTNEFLRTSAKAQGSTLMPPSNESPAIPGTQQYNQGSGQQFNAPGGTIYVNPPPSGPPHKAGRDPQAIYQSGAIVGKVFGGRRLPTDATVYQFVEITNANQLNANAPFEYDGVLLVLTTVQSRVGFDVSRPQDGMVYGGIIARVVGIAE